VGSQIAKEHKGCTKHWRRRNGVVIRYRGGEMGAGDV
jgi:hypothetical protein